MLPVNLRAARKFTGHCPLHRPHTAVPSVSWVGISPKLKSTCQDQNNVSTSYIFLIYDNLYQYQPMMTPVTVDIDKSDFPLTLLKCVTRFIDAIHLLTEIEVSQITKTLMNAHFYRTVIVVKTHPYINTSVKMLNKMLYQRMIVDFSADFESMINVLLCQPIITSYGLGAFISFLAVIQCFCIYSNTTVLMCCTNITHLPNKKNVHSLY